MQIHGGQDINLTVELISDFSVTTSLNGPNQIGIGEIEKDILSIQHYPNQNFDPYIKNINNFIFKNNIVNNHIILGNGASELIDLTIRAISRYCKTWRSGLSEVQYLEYERCCYINNLVKNDSKDEETDLLCMINPNNPTGDYLNLNSLKKYIIDNCQINSYVIIDESMQPWYGEQWREDSLVSQTNWIKEIAESKNIYIFIIHSWTKFFHCPGLRIGSLICPTLELFEYIQSIKIPWSVNVLALKYLDCCVKDNSYMTYIWDHTRRYRKDQIEQLKKLFPNWIFYGSDFISWIWIETNNKTLASFCYQMCKFKGVPIRLGKNGYQKDSCLRIAVKNPDKFSILLSTLTEIKSLISSNINDIQENPIIIKQDMIDIDQIKIHEHYINDRHNSLLNYINSLNKKICMPSIIVCSETFTLIDGHHRLSILKYFKQKKIPVLLINYQYSNIVVDINDSTITKNQVIESAITGNLLPPKSTNHHLILDDQSLVPILTLSPNIYFDFNEI